MMREAEYSEAAVEVLDILNHTEKDDVAKIPQSFIKFLTDISNKNYKAYDCYCYSCLTDSFFNKIFSLIDSFIISFWRSVADEFI